jgi:hypothetical protein
VRRSSSSSSSSDDDEVDAAQFSARAGPALESDELIPDEGGYSVRDIRGVVKALGTTDEPLADDLGRKLPSRTRFAALEHRFGTGASVRNHLTPEMSAILNEL